ncbi:hypothetical protein FOCC_FOCC012927 [Frankliniella occidentalis]|nr:hypothetical protein FOCC_FOCC012927 [Frankliniella occidentalis]
MGYTLGNTTASVKYSAKKRGFEKNRNTERKKERKKERKEERKKGRKEERKKGRKRKKRKKRKKYDYSIDERWYWYGSHCTNQASMCFMELSHAA